MTRRAKFVEEFRPYLEESYAKLSDEQETPSFRYSPMGLDDTIANETDARELLILEFKSHEGEELRRGVDELPTRRLRSFLLPHAGTFLESSHECTPR